MDRSFIYHAPVAKYSEIETKSGEKEYFVEGYVTSEDLDLVNDIVTKSCMDGIDKQFSERPIKLDFEHETIRGKDFLDSELNKTRIPLGMRVEHRKDAKGNYVKFKFNPSWKKFDSKDNVVMEFKDIWYNVKNKFLDSFSIAYVPVKTAHRTINNVKARLLDSVNVLSVALTGNPINPSANITAVMAKSLDYMREQEELESKAKYPWDQCIRDRIRDGYSMESAKKICGSIRARSQGKSIQEYNKEEKTMTEDNPDNTPPTVPPSSPPENGENNTDEIKEEMKSIKKEFIEAKSIFEEKSKKLSEKIDELEKENKELKSILEKPQIKSLFEGNHVNVTSQNKIITPLQTI